MQNPLANFIGVFSLVRDDRGFQVNPLCRHDITRSDRQIGNWGYIRNSETFYCIINQINAGLMSISKFFQKHTFTNPKHLNCIV